MPPSPRRQNQGEVPRAGASEAVFRCLYDADIILLIQDAIKWLEASRLQVPFSVCMFDIDKFKIYNDTFIRPRCSFSMSERLVIRITGRCLVMTSS